MKSLFAVFLTFLLFFGFSCSGDKNDEQLAEDVNQAMEEVEDAMGEVESAMEEVEKTMEEIELTLDDVPEVVQKAFEEAFSSIEEVQWEMERGLFEAEYEIDGMEFGIYFNSDGIIIAREKEINPEDLPPAVLNVIEQEYAGFEFDDVEMIEYEDGVQYEIELETEKVEVELLIDADGTIREKHEEYEDEGD
jgi:Putative beta-lactamase-inhibitor-like, PepSY-like